MRDARGISASFRRDFTGAFPGHGERSVADRCRSTERPPAGNGIPANALLNILAKCGSLGIRKQTAADSRRISTKSIDR